MKTQITLILLGLGLAGGSVYAAHGAETPMPASNDIDVVAPAQQQGMWSFGLMAVLMQPTNNTFQYANNYDYDTDGNELNTKLYRVQENYHLWFAADVTYAFPGYGRDVTLAYEGLHGHDSNSTTDPNFELESTFDLDNAYYKGEDFETAAGRLDTQYDAVDLVFGQKLNVGSRVQLHPFAGLRYAYIDTKAKGTYTGGFFRPFDGEDTTENSLLENKFDGIGPRLGSDATVELGKGFSIHGRLGASLLIGSRKVTTNSEYTYLIDGDPGDPGTTDLPYDRKSDKLVIPEIDGRLGVNYLYHFDTKTDLSFEAGWQATNYFDVISSQLDMSSNDNFASSSNFGVQGPYARVQLDIA